MSVHVYVCFHSQSVSIGGEVAIVISYVVSSAAFVEGREVWNISEVSGDYRHVPYNLRRQVLSSHFILLLFRAMCCLPLSFNTTHTTPPSVFIPRTLRTVHTLLAPHVRHVEYPRSRQLFVAAPTSS
jgi:hypothetical protein